jgi:hypothetical protein
MCKLHSRYYRYVATDPLGNVRGFLGIRGALFGNRGSKCFLVFSMCIIFKDQLL